MVIAQKNGHEYIVYIGLDSERATRSAFSFFYRKPVFMCVDLHTHSIYSDGTSTPAELVELAVHNGLRALALTDHDTIEGVAETQQLGEQGGITILTGLEISTTLRQYTLHILGYGIDPNHQELQQWLLPLQQGRSNRNNAILHKLQDLGINISAEEIRTISHCGQTGRPHFARLLIAKGVVDSFDAAFRLYLGRNKPAWERRFSYSAAETIAMIHRAGGVAVLAHPGQLDPEMRAQPPLIRELTLRGLDGLEIYYPTHSKKMRKNLMAMAAECGLIATGGSDFHGDTRPANRLAGTNKIFCPPYSIIEAITARKNGHNR